MIKFYYNIDNVLEGYTNKSNFEEKYRIIFKLLNKNVKTELDENILFNSIMGNFKELMKLLNVRDDVVPVRCVKVNLVIGVNVQRHVVEERKLDDLMNYKKQVRQNKIYMKMGKNNQKCFERICNDGENCEDDIDCLSGYCDRDRNTCSYRNMCS